IVFINKENTAAYTCWKTGNDLYRSRWLRFLFGAPDRRARGALGEIFWSADKSSQRAGRHYRGRTQIHQRIAIAHASFEISISRADRGLAFFHQTAPEANACATTGGERNCACVQQCLPIASGLGPRLHFGAGCGE